MHGLAYLLDVSRWWKPDFAENTGSVASHQRRTFLRSHALNRGLKGLFAAADTFRKGRNTMKKTLLNVGLVFILSLSSLSQQAIDVEFSNSGGQLTPTSFRQLQFTSAKLVSASQDGQPPFIAGWVGNVTFTTPLFNRGNIQAGGEFGPGGSFYISTPYDVEINATFVHGTWIRSSLPNRTYNYVLTGQIAGTMFWNGTNYNIQGISVQLSTNTGTAYFSDTALTSGGTTDVVTVP
jgi:hypothetical protein